MKATTGGSECPELNDMTAFNVGKRGWGGMVSLKSLFFFLQQQTKLESVIHPSWNSNNLLVLIGTLRKQFSKNSELLEP